MARTRASDFEEKRHSLLMTAAHVFASQGMDKASMAQIASEAGVSKSLLYHYYPSKDALIFAIIHTHLETMDLALVQADDAALAPRDRLRALVRTVLEAYRGADDAHKVQLNAGPALSDDQKARIVAVERRIVRRFSSVLREVRPGLDRADRPLLMPVTMSLFGMLNWVYMWFREGGPVSREDYAELATTLILQGVDGVA
ncbi:TetR/AcrR family transcriptional regulator [Psychromarinibacter sp. C21-152]|uniref:TetR/AcrR family transcriptional regulator n=1 Tax=Psychromarinibacter sediminicola TaxID=3033385 RepID=A0AAE3TAA3_9RHOB|nr:TetR/AcrR family transcriptional regulator [Psychromarinibacter sediminicola]MDF0603067.1 TetR/AcrR family transcriptional regulator [Psychromarinibacter sediminicola]